VWTARGPVVVAYEPGLVTPRAGSQAELADRADEDRGDHAGEPDHDAASHAEERQPHTTDFGAELTDVGIDARETRVHPVPEVVEPLVGPGGAFHRHSVDPRLPCNAGRAAADAESSLFGDEDVRRASGLVVVA
jgi:hypothetical protein